MSKQYPVRKSFSNLVNFEMNAKHIKQSDLVETSLLSKTTISRICRNSNDKGSIYLPTLNVVWAVSVGLELNREQAKNLLFSAFPDMEMWGDFLDERLSIHKVNIILDENGLSPWGNVTE